MSSVAPPPQPQTPSAGEPTPERPFRRLPIRYDARLVHDSLCHRAAKLLCSAFLSLLTAAAIILFVVWLALRPHRPRFHLSSFSASGLPAADDLSFSFEVAARNPNREIGIYYDSFYAAVFYRDDRVGSSASPASGPFYHRPKNTTVIRGTSSGSAPAAAAGEIASEAATGSVGFRLELTSVIRFRVSSWLNKQGHRLHVSCDVDVGPDGALEPESKDRRCSIYFF